MMHVASRAALSAACVVFGSGMASAATDIGVEQLEQFKLAVSEPAAWFHKDGTSRLDLAVLVPAQGGATRKSLDGKAQVVVKKGVLKVRVGAFGMSTSLRAYDVSRAQIDAWYKRTQSRDSYASLMGQQAQRIANNAGLNCNWKRSPSDNLNSHCVYSTAELIERFIAFNVKPCLKDSASSCMEVEGKQWAVARAAGGESRKKGSRERIETLLPLFMTEMLPPVLDVVDANGTILKGYKIEFDYSDRPGPEDVVLGTVIKSSFPRDDFAIVETLTLDTLMRASILLESRAYLKAEAETKEKLAEAKRQSKLLQELRAHPGAFGALRVNGQSASRTCTTGSEANGRAAADASRQGMLHTGPFRAWSGTKADRYDEVFPDLPSLFSALSSKRCQVVVESAANLVKLADAFQRDKADFVLMDATLDAGQLREPYARSRGFDNTQDLALAEKFEIGPGRLKEYRAAGIHTEADYVGALSRMEQSGYRGSKLSLLAFISDEKAAATRQIPVAQYQSERLAKEQKEAQARRQAKLNEKPYRIELSCGMGGQSFSVVVCLQADGNSPTIHLRDAKDYKTYRYFDLATLGSMDGGTFTFTVPPKFKVGVQNGSDTATMRMKVTDLRTNAVVHQEAAGPYQDIIFER